MCLGMGGGNRQPVQQELPERNAAPTVTGEQTGVDNPKDTKKATDELMIKRQKEEGRYNPESTNTTTADKLQQTGGGKYTIKRDSTGKLTKKKTSAYRKSLRNKVKTSNKGN